MAARSKTIRFDPQSLDAQFSEVRTLLINHFADDTNRFADQKELLKDILLETQKTNGRVTANDNRITVVEGRRKWLIGWVAGATTAAGSLTALIVKLLH